MRANNALVAATFAEIADLLDIQGANPFRIRAYRNARRTLEDLGRDVATLEEHGQNLTDLPGIGEDLAGKIREILQTGHCQLLVRLRHELPPGVGQLLHLEGLGPKRVRTLWQELDVGTPEQLLRAAQDGRIRTLHGFGPALERRILESARAHLRHQPRFKLATAARFAEEYVAFLRAVPGVRQVEVAGSFRRMRESVGDLDLLVTADAGSLVAERFVHFERVVHVRVSGRARATVVLQGGLQVDLRVVEPMQFGAALQYFTGSKAHNIALRRWAQSQGLKLNEYGLFRGGRRVAGETEVSVYAALGMDWIPPELREDTGEIEAARSHALPVLVERGDLRGDLHVHTNASDGHHSLREMARAARAQGLQYLAVTEHSRRLGIARGLDGPALVRQALEVDRLNAELSDMTVFKGVEVDILEDGSLDLPDPVLSALDLVVVAIHSAFHLSREKQTRRLLRALDHPAARILAHPTGRLIEEREPYDVDLRRVLRHARERGVALELNAHPSRLDLNDSWCRQARDEGVPVVISSDAHSTHDFDMLRYGVGQARRGWLRAQDVLNTRDLVGFERWLVRSDVA